MNPAKHCNVKNFYVLESINFSNVLFEVNLCDSRYAFLGQIILLFRSYQKVFITKRNVRETCHTFGKRLALHKCL